MERVSKIFSRTIDIITSRGFVINLFIAVLIIGLITAISRQSSEPNVFSVDESRADYVAAFDEVSIAEFTYSVSNDTNSLVADHISNKFKEVNAQVAMATIADNYLGKPQVVTTKGASREVISYVVKSGETLSDISRKFNITSNTIRWANNIDVYENPSPGQVLQILPVSGVLYTVRSGDTVQSIAEAHSANAQQIISFNDLEVSGVKPGSQIIIPDGIIPYESYSYARISLCGPDEPTHNIEVERGQIIGFAGNTGRSFGTHLHFGICNKKGVSGQDISPLDPNSNCSRGYSTESCRLKYGYSWPVEDRSFAYISAYGWRCLNYCALHQGIDIDATPGYPVRAVADGRIIFQGKINGGGFSIVVEHEDGRTTNYLHLNRNKPFNQ